MDKLESKLKLITDIKNSTLGHDLVPLEDQLSQVNDVGVGDVDMSKSVQCTEETNTSGVLNMVFGARETVVPEDAVRLLRSTTFRNPCDFTMATTFGFEILTLPASRRKNTSESSSSFEILSNAAGKSSRSSSETELVESGDSKQREDLKLPLADVSQNIPHLVCVFHFNNLISVPITTYISIYTEY